MNVEYPITSLYHMLQPLLCCEVYVTTTSHIFLKDFAIAVKIWIGLSILGSCFQRTSSPKGTRVLALIRNVVLIACIFVPSGDDSPPSCELLRANGQEDFCILF